MLFVLLLALAYGTPNMEFPWWVWLLSLMTTAGSVIEINHNYRRQ